jgi:hypothetical protein
MWQHRYLRWLMLGLLFVPLAIANWVLGNPVIEHQSHGGPQTAVVTEQAYTPQYANLNAGTAAALTRPPHGYPQEQPLPKPYREITFPDPASEIFEATIVTREPFYFFRDL